MKNHPWGKARTYLILIGICVGIILLDFLVITIFDKMGKGEYINDNIMPLTGPLSNNVTIRYYDLSIYLGFLFNFMKDEQ